MCYFIGLPRPPGNIIILLEQFLHKLYAANITIGLDGSMLVSSTRERVLAWGAVFCISASVCLLTWLLWRKKHSGRLATVMFLATLAIPVLIIPSVRNEYIHASRKAITVESGAWYRPSRVVLEMADVKSIRETDGKGLLPGNLIGDPDISWHITWHDGKSRVLELNEFFNAHRMVIAYYYKDRGYWLERLED